MHAGSATRRRRTAAATLQGLRGSLGETGFLARQRRCACLRRGEFFGLRRFGLRLLGLLGRLRALLLQHLRLLHGGFVLQALAREFGARGRGIGLAGLQHDLVVLALQLVEPGAIGIRLCRRPGQLDPLLGHEQRMFTRAAAGVLQVADCVARECLLGDRILAEHGVGAQLFELGGQPGDVGILGCGMRLRCGEADDQRARQRGGEDRALHGFTPGSG